MPKVNFLTTNLSNTNFEPGGRSGLYQFKDTDGDGLDDETKMSKKMYDESLALAKKGSAPETDFDKVERTGNQDAKILAAVYEQFISDKTLTKQEIDKLEYLDNALGGADIAVNPKTGNASILQNDDAQTFNLQFPGGGKGGKKR